MAQVNPQTHPDPIVITDENGFTTADIKHLAGADALSVAILDGSGNQITSFGGGTQFADNAVSGATPTGTLSMAWDSANSKVRALKVDASQNLETVVQNFPTTQVVSAVSLPLPDGAAIAAKQPAL